MGIVKGEPNRYLKGHQTRVGENNHNWKGGRIISNGYVKVHNPQHSRSNSRGYVLEHIIIAEKALGKPLPERSEVHHDGRRSDNT